jgi:putative transposase
LTEDHWFFEDGFRLALFRFFRGSLTHRRRAGFSLPRALEESTMLRRHSPFQGIGTVHFVTTVTQQRGRWFVEPQLCTEVLSIFENYRIKFDLICYGYVMMPDHFHVLLAQTTDVGTVSRALEHFKRFSSRKLLGIHCPDAMGWCESFDDVPVPGPDAIRTKLIYMHENPVKAGMCESALDYLWSSARWVATGEAGIITLTPNPM